MLTAPRVPFNATLAAAPSGAAGIFHTAALMRRYIDSGRVDARIIDAATGVIYMTPERDECAEVDALYRFVRDHIRYVRDPVGVESLSVPTMTLSRGVGDCDDQSTLLGALLESVGYPVRIVIAAYDLPGNWSHVYLQAFCAGDWYDLDPTEYLAVGMAPGNPVSLWIEPR